MKNPSDNGQAEVRRQAEVRPSGTYWCNHCEDNAFSETCWRCHRVADFIPETGSARASRAAADAPSTAPGAPSRVLVAPLKYVTPPAEWFRRMRESINT